MFAVRLLNICAHIIDEATPGPPPTKPTLPSLPNPPSLSPIRRRGRGGITVKEDRSSPQGTPAKEKGSVRTPSKGLCYEVELLKRLKVLVAVHGMPISQLRDVTCHMGSHSVTCHPTQCKGSNSCSWVPISQLRDVTCHMGSHSVTCHPTQCNVM